MTRTLVNRGEHVVIGMVFVSWLIFILFALAHRFDASYDFFAGDEKSRKKIKREPNLSDYKDVKKIKADSELASGVDLGMLASTNGLPTKVAMKRNTRKMGI